MSELFDRKKSMNVKYNTILYFFSVHYSLSVFELIFLFLNRLFLRTLTRELQRKPDPDQGGDSRPAAHRRPLHLPTSGQTGISDGRGYPPGLWIRPNAGKKLGPFLGLFFWTPISHVLRYPHPVGYPRPILGGSLPDPPGFKK